MVLSTRTSRAQTADTQYQLIGAAEDLDWHCSKYPAQVLLVGCDHIPDYLLNNPNGGHHGNHYCKSIN